MNLFHLARNRWARLSGDNTCWVYLHLPKTAGGSLSFALRRHFGGESVAGFFVFEVSDRKASLDVMMRRRFRIIGGHLGRNDIERLEARWPNVHFRYFTFLREPVARLASAYRHGLKALLHLPKPEHITPKSDPALLSGLYNTQARQLAYGYDFLDTPKNVANDQIFSRAMETLNRCEFVGFYENLEQELPDLFYLMGIRNPVDLPVIHATRQIPFQFDEKDLNAARALTQLDLQVYQTALKRRQALPRDCRVAGVARSEPLAH